ncbi:hypothetical protein DL768_010479 [Monosporascus sp. mg162]|nr:hypothetical protein DL768_010479 [Monosporascus sp. mg162]
MPATRSRKGKEKEDDVADLAHFQDWAAAEIKSRELTRRDFDNFVAKVLSSNNDHLGADQLTEIEAWVGRHPKKTKGKKKASKTIAESQPIIAQAIAKSTGREQLAAESSRTAEQSQPLATRATAKEQPKQPAAAPSRNARAEAYEGLAALQARAAEKNRQLNQPTALQHAAQLARLAEQAQQAAQEAAEKAAEEAEEAEIQSMLDGVDANIQRLNRLTGATPPRTQTPETTYPRLTAPLASRLTTPSALRYEKPSGLRLTTLSAPRLTRPVALGGESSESQVRVANQINKLLKKPTSLNKVKKKDTRTAASLRLGGRRKPKKALEIAARYGLTYNGLGQITLINTDDLTMQDIVHELSDDLVKEDVTMEDLNELTAPMGLTVEEVLSEAGLRVENASIEDLINGILEMRLTEVVDDSRGFQSRSPRMSPELQVTSRDEISMADYSDSEDGNGHQETGGDELQGTAGGEGQVAGGNPQGTAGGEDQESGGGELQGTAGGENQDTESGEDEEEDNGTWAGPPKDFDTAAALKKYPLAIKEHVVTSKTPNILQYRDRVGGPKKVQATIHWCTARGQLFVSFPGRNKDYPGVRAGAIVPAAQCRQAKKNFMNSGGRVATHRAAETFEDLDLEDFELLVIGSAPDKKDADRYPETHLLGRFKSETHTSSFLRSTFNSVFGEEAAEEIYAKQRDCDGSPHPYKALVEGWAKSPSTSASGRGLPGRERLGQGLPGRYALRSRIATAHPIPTRR